MGFPHQGHLIDLPMAGLAADALVDVDTMVEVDKVRQIVHPVPLYGHIIAEARPHWFEYRRFGPDLGMAGHAGFRRWDAGERAHFY